MSKSSRILRGGARATTGLLITGTAAAAVLLLGTLTLPQVHADPLSVEVSTEQASKRALVCAGSFAELGLIPNEPTLALPNGGATLVVAGKAEESIELRRQEPGSGTLPAVHFTTSAAPLGVAQSQAVISEKLRGLAASSCTEPVNEQWLVGGDTRVGAATTLSLGNPSDVPATVQITLYDEEGQIEASKTAGVLVAPQSERTVSLNGYAPDRARLAVKVVSTGATVSATLGVGQTVDIRPFAADTVSRQLEPQLSLVIPGVANINDQKASHATEQGELDEYSVLVRVLAPGDEPGNASVRALKANGDSLDLGQIDLEPGVVNELAVQHWPADANAIVIDANIEIVGGVLGSASSKDLHDYAWFAPAPILPADTPIAAALIPGSQLALVNPGADDAEAVVERTNPGTKDKPLTVKVPAGAAVMVKAPADSVLTSDQQLFAGVRAASGADIAGYPIAPLVDREVTLTVYPR